MKLALVCPASLPATQFGGIMFLCVDIARELAKTKHDVTIYTTDLDFANNPKTFNKSLPRVELCEGFKINRSHVWFAYQLFYINPGIYFAIKKAKPDIIHTVGVRSFQSFMAALISKNHNIPLVISDQGGLTTHPDLSEISPLRKLVYKIQKPMIHFIINQAARIIVANDYEKEIFIEFASPSKISIVRNGIGLEQIHSSNASFRKKYGIEGNFVLFVGRFHKVKGIDVLLNAWASIQNSIKTTKLVIMGVDFGFQSEMLKMIDELGIKNSVIVIKKPPREDVLSAYSECEFLALPSRWELSPLTPLEGFSFKKPTISTTAHGIPHTITNRENAILVEPENSQKLADAILELLGDEKKKAQYGSAGYKLVQEVCNSRVMAEGMLKVYQEILADT